MNRKQRRAYAKELQKKSKQNALAPLPFQEAQGDKLALLEKFDTHSGLRNALRTIAHEKSEWAGIPMPLEGERLQIEPTYPYAEGLMKIGKKEAENDPNFKIRNWFYSTHRRSDIVIYEDKGKVTWGLVPAIHALDKQLRTLGCMDAWGIEQESAAVRLLGQIVRHRQFKQYMLTGSFIETSKRSGITYMFRRLRPTVAINTKGKTCKVMCTLCLHPIAYYEDSWAGAMCPTDDVVAHLMMMRGDEPMFWKRANQHAAYRPEAGL